MFFRLNFFSMFDLFQKLLATQPLHVWVDCGTTVGLKFRCARLKPGRCRCCCAVLVALLFFVRLHCPLWSMFTEIRPIMTWTNNSSTTCTNIVLPLSLTFAGIEYGFRVRCRNNKGWSQWSVDSAPMCTSSAPPDPVAGLENTSIMSRLLKMCWRVPKCNGKPVCQYEILHHSHYYHPETRRRRIEHDREESERAGNVSFHWFLPLVWPMLCCLLLLGRYRSGHFLG